MSKGSRKIKRPALRRPIPGYPGYALSFDGDIYPTASTRRVRTYQYPGLGRCVDLAVDSDAGPAVVRCLVGDLVVAAYAKPENE